MFKSAYGKTIGGQAFSHGILMRSNSRAALAVRLRSGEIKVICWKTFDYKKYKLSKIPVIKTLISLFASYIGGICAVFRFLLLLPQCYSFVSPLDILRYHGAEHKTIRCYEDGLELNRENIMQKTRFHPRCGTGLIAYVLICELIAYVFIPKKIYKSNYDTVSFIAFIVGLFAGYNAIMYSSKHNTKLARILEKPSFIAQHLTVLEPKPYMIDCAIAAVNAVIS